MEKIAEMGEMFAKLKTQQTHLEQQQSHLEQQQSHLEQQQSHLEQQQSHLEQQQSDLEQQQSDLEQQQSDLEQQQSDLEQQQSDHELEVERNRRNGADALAHMNKDDKGGTTYIRWGRTSCPGNGSVTVYKGFAAGPHYDHYGGGAAMLCLTYNPEYGKNDGRQTHYGGHLFGTEYRDPRNSLIFSMDSTTHDVTCVVCDVRRRTSLMMIPGRKSCYPGWTMEYWGYLMTGSYRHKAEIPYYCIDAHPQPQTGGRRNEGGNLLYFVDALCGSLDCPPYVHGRELTCVVCTK